MNAEPQEKNKMTPAEYLEMERSSMDIKHEFYNGEIFAMVGAKFNHNQINVNIIRELGMKLKDCKSPCNPLSNDMRVKIEDKYVYPDIVIYCGEPEFEDDESDTLINPVVIIEILSESTETYDRGKKFKAYQRISTLKEYILVSQYEYSVEQYIRTKDIWQYKLYDKEEQTVKIESVNCDLHLSEIYLNVEFKPGLKTQHG